MFYVVCAYILLGVVGMVFLPSYVPETKYEKYKRIQEEKRLQELKEMEDIEKWAREA